MQKESCDVLWETLIDYADERLDATRRTLLDAHLKTDCAACWERLDWLNETVPALNNALFEMPPSRTVQQTKDLFRDKHSKPSLFAALAQQIFDSRMQTPLFAGARGSDDGTFRVLYQIGGVEVELYGETTEAQDFYLIGQARSSENAAALPPVAAILMPGDPISYDEQSMAAIESNEFHFPAIREGNHVLTLWLDNVMLSISDIRVGV